MEGMIRGELGGHRAGNCTELVVSCPSRDREAGLVGKEDLTGTRRYGLRQRETPEKGGSKEAVWKEATLNKHWGSG